VMDRTDLQLGAFQGPERSFSLFEVLVGAHDIPVREVGVGEAGP
jgi:hypothetical protein